MTDEAKLKILIEALRKIVESDPGPAYYIARAALEETEEEFSCQSQDTRVYRG